MIAAMGRGFGACACAVALACGLAGGSVAAEPHVAFAEQAGDDARAVADDPVTAQESQPSVVVADGNARLTKLTDATVLVELLQAQARTSASVKLGALDAQGNALGGCTFAFTPEALALASCHAVSHDDLLTVVVSNGTDAIAADSDRFVLGTLTVPADTARVAVLGMEGVTTSGGVDSVPGSDDVDDALSMLPGDGPGAMATRMTPRALLGRVMRTTPRSRAVRMGARLLDLVTATQMVRAAPVAARAAQAGAMAARAAQEAPRRVARATCLARGMARSWMPALCS